MKTIVILFAMLLSTQFMVSQTNPWKPVTQTSLDLEKALVAGDSKAAAIKLTELSKAISTLEEEKVSKETTKQMQLIQTAISASLKSNSLEGFRAKFSAISNALITISKSNNLWKNKLYIVYCPMKEASWITDINEVANPYYGKAMLKCGSITSTIAPK